MPSIRIDDRYWKTVRDSDYSDWKFAWGREAGQNSLDAGATEIKVAITQVGGMTIVDWADNGCGMSESVLVDKFLSLGASFKTLGNTGGFGVAKSVLAFAQKSYVIRTGDIKLTGAGSDYEIERGHSLVSGCRMTVEMEDTSAYEMSASIKRWAAWSTTATRIYLNGERLKSLRLPEKPKQQTPWCNIYVHRKNDEDWEYKVRVRINGQYMFSVWCDVKRHVTIDIVGNNSQEYLTANRDGLNWRYEDRLTKIIGQIFQDPNKITDTDVDNIELFVGTTGKVALLHKSKGVSPNPPRIRINNLGDKNIPTPALNGKSSGYSGDTLSSCPGGVEYTLRSIREGHDMIVLNNLNRPVSEKWMPGTMSVHAGKLLLRWVEILKFCAPFCRVNESVRVGFIFNTRVRAQYRYSSEHGYMVLVNPIKIDGNRLKQYWSSKAGSFYELVATAVHELTHFKYSGHGESFAKEITDNLGIVMANYPQLELIRKRTK